MSVTDPLLWQTRVADSTPFFSKLQEFANAKIVFNFLVPLLIVIIVLWVLRKRFEEKVKEQKSFPLVSTQAPNYYDDS